MGGLLTSSSFDSRGSRSWEELLILTQAIPCLPKGKQSRRARRTARVRVQQIASQATERPSDRATTPASSSYPPRLLVGHPGTSGISLGGLCQNTRACIARLGLPSLVNQPLRLLLPFDPRASGLRHCDPRPGERQPDRPWPAKRNGAGVLEPSYLLPLASNLWPLASFCWQR